MNINLPFDMFQRYMLVKEIMKCIRARNKFNILDVGGHPCPISNFFPNDNVFNIDIQYCKKDGFIRADCQFLPFRNKFFDLVTNIDVLEHLPKVKRFPVINELLRVSNHFVVIAAPTSSKEVNDSDKALYNYIFKELKLKDKNIEEHMTYGLPNFNEIKNFLKSKNLAYVEFSNGSLDTWLPMQKLNFRISDKKTYNMVNQIFNSCLYETSNREPSYRKILLIDKTAKNTSELLIRTEAVKNREFIPSSSKKGEILNLILGIMQARALLKDNQLGIYHSKTKSIQERLTGKFLKLYRRLYKRYFSTKSRRILLVEYFATFINLFNTEGILNAFRLFRYYKPYKQFSELSVKEQYKEWLRHNRIINNIKKIEISKLKYRPKISVIIPIHVCDSNWLYSAIDSVANQLYPNWELIIVSNNMVKSSVRRSLKKYSNEDSRIIVQHLKGRQDISEILNKALNMISGNFVGFLNQNDIITKDALFEVAKILNQNRNLDLIYSDEDKINLEGDRIDPFFKPDWSPDLFLSMNYINRFLVLRRDIINKIGGFNPEFEVNQEYDLLLRVSEKTENIYHIPRPLYSVRIAPGSTRTSELNVRDSAKRALDKTLYRRNIEGEVTDCLNGNYRVKYRIKDSPLVSIIIPTKNKVDLLRQCIKSIESKTSYKNYEILIVNNNSTDTKTVSYLKASRHRVIDFNKNFNFSEINNLAVRYSKGEYFLFLNNDMEVIEPDWINSMLEHSQRSNVGIVGALLLYPRNIVQRMFNRPKTIQHAGVTLGIGIAGHAFRHLPVDNNNYFNLHRVIRNCSAVTAACLMVRKKIFEEVGGFDENLKVGFGDVDLCLRVREKGYLIVYTPHAKLYHHEYATRGRKHLKEDEIYFLNRWKNTLIKVDPFYNLNLTHFREDYSLSYKGSYCVPLMVLSELFYNRADLQKNYPEAHNGDFRRLIDWATIYGVIMDETRTLLQIHDYYYIANSSENIRPLAKLISLYNKRINIQEKFPEVLEGDFRKLIKYSTVVKYSENKELIT